MTTDIGIRVTLKRSFEQAIQKTIDALKTEGFGVLTQIDVKTTLKDKINVDFRRYVILGACNPTLAILRGGARYPPRGWPRGNS